jgi:hypothetical protein
MHHRQIVARAFGIIGWLLGIPSFLLLLAAGVGYFTLPAKPPPDTSRAVDIQTYGLVGLLQDGAIGISHGLSKTFGFLNDVASWAAMVLAIISLVVLLFALILHVTSRGLFRHATWARIAAAIISIALILFFYGMLFVLPRDLLVAPGLFIAAALYTLWVLGWRYA